MRAHEIMTTSVVTVEPETPVERAAALLAENGVTSLPVLDDEARVVGIVSEGDLIRGRMPHDPRSHLRRMADEESDPPRLVREVMTADVVCLGKFADTADIAALLLESNIRALPIVDAEHLVGIVSRRDLLRTLLRDDSTIVRELTSRLADYSGEEHRWRVHVDSGVVTVRGPFDSPREETIVTVLARTVPGVVRVHTCEE